LSYIIPTEADGQKVLLLLREKTASLAVKGKPYEGDRRGRVRVVLIEMLITNDDKKKNDKEDENKENDNKEES
tara:strand:+ start:865 stop:1083 length:219 start_codon:yes stop_codon:yes gene_type:complete